MLALQQDILPSTLPVLGDSLSQRINLLLGKHLLRLASDGRKAELLVFQAVAVGDTGQELGGSGDEVLEGDEVLDGLVVVVSLIAPENSR